MFTVWTVAFAADCVVILLTLGFLGLVLQKTWQQFFIIEDNQSSSKQSEGPPRNNAISPNDSAKDDSMQTNSELTRSPGSSKATPISDTPPMMISMQNNNHHTNDIDNNTARISRKHSNSCSTNTRGRVKKKKKNKIKRHHLGSEQTYLMGLPRVSFMVLCINILIICCCVFTISYSVQYLFTYLSQSSCTLLGVIGAMVYSWHRLCSYAIFILRVETVFNGTPFSYHPRLVPTLLILDVICGLSLAIPGAILLRGNGYDRSGLKVCRLIVDPMFGVMLGLIDLFFSGVCLHLFTSPLRRIYEMEIVLTSAQPSMKSVSTVSNSDHLSRVKNLTLKNEDNNHDMPRNVVIFNPNNHDNSMNEVIQNKQQLIREQTRNSSEVRKVAVKCRLLTIVAVSSTFFHAGLALFLDFTDFAVMDMFINLCSVMFMTSWLDDWYECVCIIPIYIEWWIKRVCFRSSHSH